MSGGQSKREKEEALKREALIKQWIRDRAQALEDKVVQKSNKKTLDYLAAQEVALARQEELGRLFAERKFVPQYKGKKGRYTERKLNVILSDLHYGADLDPKQVNFRYGPTEEARRTAAIVAQVADYKRQYRAETELHVHLIGDIIQGKLHDIQNAADLTSQMDRALHCLIYGLEFLATEFKKVIVTTSVGNHGRDAQRHPERAMQDKFDSNEFRVYRAMKYRFEKVPNVEFHTPVRGFYVYDQFGMLGVMTHGDTIFKPGYPGKLINVESLHQQINKFKLSNPEYNNLALVGMGHVHTAMNVDIDGTTIITNGCLIPNDEYAQSIGIFNTPCRQQLWETVEGHMFGDHRLLKVGPAQDADSSFDSIIPTWKGLDS
jgi:hypothetical protein